ncbi:MAG: TolC family protein [Chitinophagaceae bacterium]
MNKTVYNNLHRILMIRAVMFLATISICLSGTVNAIAQQKPLSLDECIRIALANNLQIKTASLEVQRNRVLQRTSLDLPKTSLTLSQDPTSGGNMDNSAGISQNFSLPRVYINQKKALEKQTLLTERSKTITQAEISLHVKQGYYGLLYSNEKKKTLDYLDSIYSDFMHKVEARFKTGETSNLERLTAQSKFQELQLSKKENQADIEINQYRLQQLMNYNKPVLIAGDSLKPIVLQKHADSSFNNSPLIRYYDQSKDLSAARANVEKSKLLPEFTLGYNHQVVIRDFNPAKINRDYYDGTRIAGLQFGVTVPLFTSSYNARIRAEKINESIAQSKRDETERNLQTEWQQGFQRYLKYKQSLDYYLSAGLQLSDEQIRIARFAFDKGEIGYVEFIQNISAAIQSKLNYLTTVYSLNEAVITLQYLQGEEYQP